MNIGFFLRNDAETHRIAHHIKKRLQQHAYHQVVESNPDLVLSIGGDGTFLDAVQTFGFSPLYLGINTGRLGFLTEWGSHEVDELIHLLEKEMVFQEERYAVLCTTIETTNGKTSNYWSLNQMEIRSASLGSLQMKVLIDQEEMETYRGLGLVVSTPVGSTALNKALGGAIISPSMDVLQMTELGAVNNKFYQSIQNPILLSSQQTLTLVMESGTVMVGFDNQQIPYEPIHQITCHLGKEKVRIARLRPFSYWKKVKESFM